MRSSLRAPLRNFASTSRAFSGLTTKRPLPGVYGWGSESPGDSFTERTRDLRPVETKDQDIHPFARLLDGSDDGRDAGVGLNDQFHAAPAELRSKLPANPADRKLYRDVERGQRPNRTRTPTFIRRGVPIVDGFVWTK